MNERRGLVVEWRVIASMMLIFFGPALLSSQETRSASIEEVRRTHDTLNGMMERLVPLRAQMDSRETAIVFLEAVAESQELLEPIIVLIAETKAPEDALLYAISVAIAVKEADLALWHFLNAFLAEREEYLRSADTYLRRSLEEMERAASLAPTP